MLSIIAHRIPTIIFDGGSTDNTREITLRFGASFVQRPTSDTYGYTTSDLEWALNHVDTEYVLLANCSHSYSDQLISKFIKIALICHYKAVYTGFVNYRFGIEVQRSNTNKNCQSCVMFSKKTVDTRQSYVHNEAGLSCPPHLKITLEPVEKYLISINTPGSFDKLLIKNTKYAKREVDEANIKFQSKYDLSKRLLKTIYIMWSMRPKNIFSSAFLATVLLNIIYDLTIYFCSWSSGTSADQRISK